MKLRKRFVLLTLAAGIFPVFTVSLAWAQGYSHARIVRLSFVEGDVTVQRPDVQAWAQAPVNTPLEEGFKLSTGENSFAEVQFENGGTIRLGQFALLDFTQLALTASGSKINHVQLEQGYATFHARLDNDADSYELVTPSGTLTARDNTLFRVDLDSGLERVEVFKGTVDVASNIGTWALEKNSVLELRPGESEPATLSEGITKDNWDQWVEDRENRVEAAQTGPSPSNYPGSTGDSLYGWSDLAEYGNWSYLPGWGYGWMPTVVGYGWAPYAVGRWCWYPGWGYTWISVEPWGWLPYHYGAWEFVPGVGWVWFPEGFGTWSPALVTWYTGPGWIGWVPRPHPVHGSPTANPGAGDINWVPQPHPIHGKPAVNPGAEGALVGGAVVSTSTFHNGGLVESASALRINPSTGEKIDGPPIQPTGAAMLPGPPAGQPAAQSAVRPTHLGNGVRPMPGITSPGRTFTVKGGHEVPAAGVVAPAVPVRSFGVAPPDSGIIYDPSARLYENSPGATPAHESPTPRTESTVNPAQMAKPAQVEPLPAGTRALGTHAAEAPALVQPSPVVGAGTVKVAPVPDAGTTRANTPPPSPGNVRPPSASRGAPSEAPAKAEHTVSGGGHSGGGSGGGQTHPGGHPGGTTPGGPAH